MKLCLLRSPSGEGKKAPVASNQMLPQAATKDAVPSARSARWGRWQPEGLTEGAMCCVGNDAQRAGSNLTRLALRAIHPLRLRRGQGSSTFTEIFFLNPKLPCLPRRRGRWRAAPDEVDSQPMAAHTTPACFPQPPFPCLSAVTGGLQRAFNSVSIRVFTLFAGFFHRFPGVFHIFLRVFHNRKKRKTQV